MFYLCSKNKGADQLHSYSTDDSAPLFSHMQLHISHMQLQVICIKYLSNQGVVQIKNYVSIQHIIDICPCLEKTCLHDYQLGMTQIDLLSCTG